MLQTASFFNEYQKLELRVGPHSSPHSHKRMNRLLPTSNWWIQLLRGRLISWWVPRALFSEIRHSSVRARLYKTRLSLLLLLHLLSLHEQRQQKRTTLNLLILKSSAAVRLFCIYAHSRNIYTYTAAIWKAQSPQSRYLFSNITSIKTPFH